MKKDIIKIISGFFFLLLLSTLSFSQGKTYEFKDAGLSIWYPQDWSAKERGSVVYLTSKEEDINIQIELLPVSDLDNALKVTDIELKAMFPEDPSYVVNDAEINGMRVKKIEKASGNRSAKYCMLETPSSKFMRLFCITTKDIAEKYKPTLDKISENLKPM